MDGFRARALAAGGSSDQYRGLFGWGGKRGSSPAPFDAVDPFQLAGPRGSHPLAAISIDELVRRTTDGLDGEITISDPVWVGDAYRAA